MEKLEILRDGRRSRPLVRYPESVFDDISDSIESRLRGRSWLLSTAGLDASRFGTPEWNPLQELIHPGETVLLKPKWCTSAIPAIPGWRYVITHGSIIRVVADYVWKAIGPNGKIILADAPQTDASFSGMVELLGLDTIRDLYRKHGLHFEIIDLRQEEWTTRGDVVVERRKLPPNPYGSIAFDLASASEFADHPGAGHYYGADYDAGVVNHHHSGGRHEYLIAGCAIQCDVIFSLPKWKTHKKAGMTASLKNLVGVNADKNWLPHHTEGAALRRRRASQSRLKHRTERKVAAAIRRLSVRMPGWDHGFIAWPAWHWQACLRRDREHYSQRKLVWQRHGLAHVSRPEQDCFLWQSDGTLRDSGQKNRNVTTYSSTE